MLFSLLVLAHVSWAVVMAYPFQDISYEDMQKRSFALQSPFASVSDARTLLKGFVNWAGSGEHKCSPAVMRITDLSSLVEDVERPQVLISGEIHGDERVGPSSTLHMSLMLVHAAQCDVAKKDESCKYLLETFGISSPDAIAWLAVLATKRDTISIPTANCLGYRNNRRDDANVDPNRDFGYSRNNENCLMSTTAKIFNALMGRTVIQVSLSFREGTYFMLSGILDSSGSLVLYHITSLAQLMSYILISTLKHTYLPAFRNAVGDHFSRRNAGLNVRVGSSKPQQRARTQWRTRSEPRSADQCGPRWEHAGKSKS